VDDWQKISAGSVRGDLRNTYMKVHKFLASVEKAANGARSFDELLINLKGGGSDGFVSFAMAELENEKPLLREKTWTGYKNRLDIFMRNFGDVKLSSIDHDFLVRMKSKLLADGRKINGIYQDFACLKKFYRKAIEKNKVSANPFKTFALRKEETTKDWLTKDELIVLFDLLKKESISEAVKNTLRHFLFCCFTGLRFGDKRDFGKVNIQEGRILLKTSKRGKHVIIPMNEQAIDLLPYVLNRPLKKSNSRVNSDLSLCARAASINKHITFHCSRHTFAINCLLLGIDIVTVRDWLGHTSVTTTEIYAKMASMYKDKAMERFKNFF
jgi:site-specific recombinase XerD